jgi:molybdenum cofactor cytidylyltransferase
MDDIWAVVLAAGESKRMRMAKLLLSFDDKTIIEKVIDNILGSGINNIMVVLGAWKDEIMDVLENVPVSICYNKDYQTGMLSSVRCGLASLPRDASAGIVFPGDMPLIPGDIISDLVRSFRKNSGGIVVPVCNGKKGHPILISQKYFNEVYKLDDTLGLRSLADKFSYDVYEVETDNEMIFKDIDTNEDYFKAINKSE